jgi:predicted nucleotidyltransferase component of viral defense system
MEHPKLKETFVFKGGTALKKCFFGTYRFSEDLDFTALDTAPFGDSLESIVREVCNKMEDEIQEYANVSIVCERYTEKQPHPDGQEAFTIKGQFPWQREPLRKVMIEIIRSEELLFTPEKRPLLHDYEENISTQILCYTLEEIVLEKLRAILQQTQKLHERSWTRSRARDYYDLWRIFGIDSSLLAIKGFTPLLKKKCSTKGVDFQGANDFITPKMISRVKQDWKSWLAPLISDCPPVEEILKDLEESLIKIFNPKK